VRGVVLRRKRGMVEVQMIRRIDMFSVLGVWVGCNCVEVTNG
jgi:hypothetical protein